MNKIFNYKNSLTRIIILIFLLIIFLPKSGNSWEEAWKDVEARRRPIKTKRKIDKVRIKSKFMKYSIPFKVILPQHYNEDIHKRYGVVLYLCGKSGCVRGSGAYPVYFSIWCKLPRTLDNLYRGKLTKKSFAWQINNKELKEFNEELQSNPFEDFIAVDLWHPSNSKNLNFDRFIMEELFPYLDSHYRTIKDRRFRGIDGACGGAAQALIQAFRNPDFYANCGGMQTDFGSVPNTFKFFKENREKIIANPLNVNLNTNRADVCNDYYFRKKRKKDGTIEKIPAGCHARMETLLKEAGCNVHVKVFSHCKHGYSAYRYPNGHATAYFYSKMFKKYRKEMEKSGELSTSNIINSSPKNKKIDIK